MALFSSSYSYRWSVLALLISGLLMACLETSSQKPPITPPTVPPTTPPPATPPSTPPPLSVGDFPVLFVTQVPIATDFATIGSTFANHGAGIEKVGRGGDLWIRYPDGTLKNLTKAAGFGDPDGLQGVKSITVRDPAVYWDGKKALFSMVIGAPKAQYEITAFYWQIYEITNLEANDTPVITKVPNQPAGFNNISPIYGTDDRIIFTSNRPRNGEKHLYQLDEYEETEVVSGLWSLAPNTGDLKLLNHAPSGNFTPILDSFGRVVFTQWDHLKRDQQADADKYAGGNYGTFTYASEAANAPKSGLCKLDTPSNPKNCPEVFPEPRVPQETAGTNLNEHDFNQFFPWTILEDGTEGETLNHAGRQELMSGDARGYLPPSFKDDPAPVAFARPGLSANKNYITNMFQIREDPLHPGRYFGTNANEFGTHASGQIISLDAPMGLNAEKIQIENVTDPVTEVTVPENATPDPNHSGHYRDPLPLSSGAIIAAHTTETRQETGSLRYHFRMMSLKKLDNGIWTADAPLTNGIKRNLEYWNPDVKISYNGELWELQPVEVRPRPRPTRLVSSLPTPEQQVLSQAGVDETKLRDYLQKNNLALAVMRNVTTRDRADKQQPFNLRVPNGVQTLGSNGKIYDIANLQFLQADQLRSLSSSVNTGRRVLAQPMHDSAAISSNPAATVPGSAAISSDGSVAAFVPARRAMTWQLTDVAGKPVVRERYWVTFQPGEVRVCASCHGANERDQAGNPPPVNPPQALFELLQRWKTNNP